MRDLSTNERLTLEWLSLEDSSALGECHGAALDALVAFGLAVIDPPSPGRDLLYSRVRLTAAGLQAAQRGGHD